ncbi:MAG: YigZ family protein [Bacilli bacterium]|jgi:uncharacterized YigZ family protein|nr:YigZ family protein [Bacilli bacterium]
MQTILTSSQSTLIIDKSRFIGVTFHVQSSEEVEACLKEIRKQFPKAKHYCYAYVIGQDEKGFDDGEPSKTAGRPLLELLKRGEFDETLIIVVRYFGGTLLGASRLLRTYVSVANATLNATEKHEIVYLNAYQLELAYSDYDYFLNEAKKHSYILENAVFSDTIMIKLLSRENAVDILEQILKGREQITFLEPEKRYIKETST